MPMTNPNDLTAAESAMKIKMTKKVWLAGLGLLTLFGAASCADGTTAPGDSLSGQWQSEPVVLDRGDFSETYVFSVEIGADFNGILDIAYWDNAAPDGKMELRQALVVSIDDENITLTGSNPVQTAGPPIEGTYAPDELSCVLEEDVGRLDCNWGSDGHGQPIKVFLDKI